MKLNLTFWLIDCQQFIDQWIIFFNNVPVPPTQSTTVSVIIETNSGTPPPTRLTQRHNNKNLPMPVETLQRSGIGLNLCHEIASPMVQEQPIASDGLEKTSV
ncbi:hypothetical protein JTB14_036413 [Gonioctena quinquepunctata]|nr:hypothetical protein JTB14_036413 [Gonioctena quinquepunctata]